MPSPSMLRKRGARSSGLTTILRQSVHEKKKHAARHSQKLTCKSISAILISIVIILVIQRSKDEGAPVIHLETISILTTVPIGFTLSHLPIHEGSFEVFLDDKLISLMNPKTPNSMNFGTCDIADHGENVLNHAFSLGQGQLGQKTQYLKQGNHIIEVKQRRDGQQSKDYAQMEVQVDAPPELILGGGSSSQYEHAYNLALVEVGHCIACNHFVAGTGWAQLWTRDTSFAAELGAALIHPNVVKQSLYTSVETLANGNEVWLQDKCGHFGGWPNLSDAIVGTRGAWAFYLATGDKEFLKWAYHVTKDSLHRAEDEVFDNDSGLFKGCSSFLESNSGYPEKYMDDGELVGKTKALSTNMLYYAGYNLAAKMGKELEIDHKHINTLEDKAISLKAAIQKRLWSEEKNNYAYFEDENGILVNNNEGLGSSLALLDFNDEERNAAMLKSTYTTEYGIPCLWPQFPHTPGFFQFRIARHYHNGRIWPFVQGYFAIAAAHHKQMELLSHELKGLTALSQKGNTFAEFYQLNGTFPEERREQLWSATGYLAMIYHGVFGIRLGLDGIRFSPMKSPDLFDAAIIHLNNVRYRGMILNIHLSGQGTTIESFHLNHEKQNEPFIAADEAGVFDIDISLTN